VSSLDATGHRDNQRARLYDAEHVIKNSITSKAARKYLIDEARLIPQNGWYMGPVIRKDKNGKDKGYSPSIEDCQRFVDHVVRTAWFQRRWGQRTFTVVWKASGKATSSTGGTIALPPWSRTEGVILHEMAHGLRTEGAWHGEQFAAILLTLVRHQMGSEKAAALRASFRQYRVKVKTSALPKPTLPVVSATQRRQRVAARQEREAARLLGPVNRSRAAMVIHVLAKTNVCGAPGSKPRRYAQDAARVMGPNVRSTSCKTYYVPPEEMRIVAETVRALVRSEGYGPVGSKPRARAMALARTLDKAADDRAGRARAVGLAGKRVYAAKPQKW
jgi:hypothetical protein